jgi:hypothetical protein
MNASRLLSSACAIAILCGFAGCASVMSGRHAEVTFYSNVPDAHVAIRDKHGNPVAATQAGSTVALKRKDKWIFPAKYIATVQAPGYQPAEVPIGSTVNPWVLGNVAFLQLGLVGLAVDNATGAAWMPKESTYYQELQPMYGQSPYGPALIGAASPMQNTLVGHSAVPTQHGIPTSPLVVAAPPATVIPPQSVSAPSHTEATLQTAAATSAVPSTPIYR